ncbi:MAG: FAD-dependent oxidoreductase [Thermoprotei archaeon]
MSLKPLCMESFDVVVVGAGPAGSTAAFSAAKQGANVLLLERGPEPGTKTVSGGLLYTHVLSDIIPEFWKEEFYERYVTRYSLAFLGGQRSTCIDFRDESHSAPPFNCVSVLRNNLDKRLAKQAQEAGAVVASSVLVDGLIVSGGRVTGIRSGSDEIGAKVVVVCDGINSLILKQAGLKGEWKGDQLGVGIKQVIELPRQTIEERFNLNGREGSEYTFIGFPPGVEGGGFMYTNMESVSLGLIINLESMVKSKLEASEIVEQFKAHPLISRLIEGGSVAEYSTCLVAEGGVRMIPKLYSNGLLVAGSAAGLVLNNAFNLRGMDFAIASGNIAGDVAAKISKTSMPSETVFAQYQNRLEESFVLKELRKYDRASKFLENPRLYSAYPEALCEFMHRMYTVGPQSRGHLYSELKQSMQGTSTFRLLSDMLTAARNL